MNIDAPYRIQSPLSKNTQATPLPDAGSLICIQIGEDGTISEWSEGATRLFGWTGQEMLGQPSSRLAKELGQTGNGGSDAVVQTKGGQKLAIRSWMVSVEASHLLLIQDRSEEKFLQKALLEAAEREQRRIGQELHDHLCQHLLGAAFATKALAGALDRDKSTHAPALHDLARLVNDAVAQTRDISRGLHPVELDADGLMFALKSLAGRASRTVPCEFRCTQNILISDPERALQAYRIAQEGIAAALHTNAKQITISLSEDANTIDLFVKDDGMIAGELTTDPLGTGARTLHYRARALGGTLSITFQPEQGTTLHCSFPKS